MSDEDLTKHTLHLRRGDYATIRDAFPQTGAAVVIRKIVSDFVDQLSPPVTAKELARLKKTEPSDV
jgi:hypothetical protein